MKTLLLMRHAKSSWKHPELADHDRPLSKRGTRDAGLMGQLIAERELTPQIILSSSAVRTLETAAILAEQCKCTSEIKSLDGLYLAEADAYLIELRLLPDDTERAMVIGHNPGLESLLQILTHRVESLPTAVVAYLSLPISQWSELSSDTEGELIELWIPKELREEDEKHDKKKKKTHKKKKD